MITPKVLNLILALQVLTTLIMYVNTLPITSKPIENTAENLAWQAWLMLPPEQKNLEKSRKVTPKSIFTLPFRECPPGHHLFENRCIPTVQIDQTALLTQELLGFVDGSADINYEEFDYEDFGDGGGGEVEADIMYDIPLQQKLSGDESLNDTYEQLPTQDEPLKFNIFQQKFPTDYDNMPIISDEAEPEQKIMRAKSNNSTIKPLAEAVNALAISASIENNEKSNSSQNANFDQQMESSNISTNILETAAAAATTNNDHYITPTTFSLSDIDAIILPATQHNNNEADDLDTKKPYIQKLSLLKDDNSVQLVTTGLLGEHNNINNENNNKQPDFTQMLKVDNLLPLPNIAATTIKTIMDTTATTTATATRTTTKKGNIDNEVPTLSTSFTARTTTSSSSTIPLGNNSMNDEVTDMMLSDVETTMSTLPSDLPENIKRDVKKTNEAAKQTETEIKFETKKAEHPRSAEVTDWETEAQELSFSTTTEADATTNFQLDETTIVETHDAPRIALKELMELTPSNADDIVVDLSEDKKSKVEIVELPPVEPTTFETSTLWPEAITTDKMTTTAKATNKVSVSSRQPTTLMMTTTTTTTTPLLKTGGIITTATSMKTTDRFDNFNQKHKMSTKTGEDANDNDDDNSDKRNFRNTETMTATPTSKTIPTTETTEMLMTTKTSETDIKQELHMINELVKGNDENNSLLTTTVEAESGRTTIPTTTTTTTASALTSNQVKILNKEESSLSSSIDSTVTVDNSTPSSMTTTTPTESTSTLWSKIMPLLSIGSSNSSDNHNESSSTTQTNEDTTSATPPLSTASTKSSHSENIINNYNLSNNRRNSKIIRINSLSSFSSSKLDKTHITNNDSNNKANSIQVADKLSSTSSTTMPPATTATTTITTTEASTTIISDTDDSESEKIEPFWWLPIGWRLDDSNEPSLLLRFWSALPGQGQ